MPLDHALRRTGLGGTDIAGVLGFDPERDLHAVWAQKVGGLLPPPPTWRATLGKFLERAVIDIYAARTGLRVEPLFDRTIRHPQFPHVLATPDALASDGRGVDAKTVSWDQRHQWGPTADDIPDRVQLQMVTYMEVLDRDQWDIALLSGDQFRIIEMHRDREFGNYVVSEAERIWMKYFETRESPPIGGSRASAAWLQQAYPAHKRPDLRLATEEEIAELRRYGRLRAGQKALAAERAKLENWLKEAIKDREGLVWDGGRFTWRRTADSQTIDWHSMALALLTNFIKDDELRRQLTESYTNPKPGTRRIWFSSDECFGEPDGEEAVDDAA